MKKVFYLLVIILLNAITSASIYAQWSGQGTPQNPYQIKTTSDLISMYTNLMQGTCNEATYSGKHFRLMNDIDFSAPGSDAPTWSTPIGSPSCRFTGYFHGGNHKITGLELDNRGIEYAGLFGANAGTIDSVTIKGTTMRGGLYAGGLVGYNTGKIIFCHTDISADAFSTSDSYKTYAGGLVGYNEGVIQSSSAEGKVYAYSADAAYAGGLVGYSASVGSNNSSIKDCFAKGSVEASAFGTDNAHAGGLVGYLYGGFVTNCYAIGIPKAYNQTNDVQRYRGALVGYNENANILHCYYNKDKTGEIHAVGNMTAESAHGQTTDHMKIKGTYNANWDFNNVWGINGDYPYLRDKPLRLTNITVNAGTLTPTFHSDSLTYTVDAGNATNITVTATSDLVPPITITESLKPGKNSIPITITHHGGELGYTVNVHHKYELILKSTCSGTINTVKVNIGAGINTLPIPAVCNGYEFKEWNAKDGTVFDSVTIQNAVDVDTLYAKWQPKQYTVHFNANASDASVSPVSKEVTFGTPVGELPVPVRTHYDFTGWNTKPDSTAGRNYENNTLYDIPSDTTFYAKWQAKKYTLTFDVNGGNLLSPTHKDVQYDDAVGTLPVPTRPGWKFIEWNTQADGAGTEYKSTTIYKVTGNTTIYAIWDSEKYTLHFDPQGGTPQPADKTISYGESVGTLPTLNARQHYTSYLWNTKPDGTGVTYTDNAAYEISSNTTFYAVWTGEPYKLRLNFNYNGCPPPQTKDVNYGTEVTLPDPNSRTGYTFEGWNTKDDGTGYAYTTPFVYLETTDLTLFAKWTPKQYTVTFDANSGTVTPANRLVNYGEAVGTLPTPTRGEYYTFGGWNTNLDGSGITYEATTPITQNITVYAQWTGKSSKLFFEAAGGNVTSSEKDVYYGSQVGTLPVPNFNGYKFMGWFTAAGGSGKKYESTTVYDETSDTRLYANWAAETYYLKFLNNYSGALISPPSDQPVTYNAAVGNLPPTSRPNYDFKGWNTKEDGSGTQYTETTRYQTVGNTELYAQWSGKEYKLKFEDPSFSVTSIPDKKVYYGSPVGELPTDIRSGYTPKWNTASDGSGDTYTKNTIAEGNKTLYAQWENNAYTLIFDPQSGSVTPTNKPVTYEQTIGTLPVATRTGYTFKGWFPEINNGTEYTASTVYTIAGDKTVYAKWQGNTYSLSFDSPEGSIISFSSQPVIYGDHVGTLPDAGSRTNYSFDGWNTKADGSGTKYESTTVYDIVGDATLYGTWKGDPYTLTFHPEGGTVDTPTKEVYYDAPVGALPTPKYPGYKFEEWNTNQLGGGVTYTASTRYMTLAPTDLYAQWTLRKYEINFNTNYSGGESFPPVKDIIYGSSVSSLPTPIAREHYTFSGWNTVSDGTGVNFNTTTLYEFDDDITLFAKWTGDPHTLKFNPNYSDAAVTLPDKSINYGSKVGNLLPTTLSRQGYKLTGWNTASNGSGKPYTSVTVYEETELETTLFAQWAPEIYVLYFEAPDGNVSPTQKDVTYNEVVKNLPNPTRTGYDFKEWNTKPDGSGDVYPPATPYTNAGNTTIYAQWTAAKYTLTFNPNKGSTPEPHRTVVYDSPIGTLPTPTRTGYDFEGWNATQDGTGKGYAHTDKYTETQSITVYAQWKANEYQIIFNNNGIGKITPSYPISVTYDQPIGTTLPTAEHANYIFNGWNTAQDGSGTSDIDENYIYRTADNTILYAQWTGKLYTVTFDPGVDGEVFPTSKSVTFGEKVGSLPVPSRTGYTGKWFDGENGTGTEYDENTIVIGAVTLHAKWTPIEYKLKFDINYEGGTDPQEQPVVYDKAISHLPMIMRQGYTLKEWNTAQDGSGTKYATGKIYDVADDVTLYAQWTPVEYKITFIPEGGSSVDNLAVTYDAPVGTLPTSTRAGYVFAGWFTVANGGEEYTENTVYTTANNIFLYAQWTADTYFLTFDSQGGNTINDKQVTYQSPVGALTDPVRKGYTFDGWFTEENGGGVQYSATTVYNIVGDKLLYAKWTAKQYNVVFDTQSEVVVSSIQADYDAIVSLPDALVRAGYIFKEWNTAKDGKSSAYSGTMKYTFDSDLTLYAQWTARTYILNFDANGGNPVNTQISVTYDAAVRQQLPVTERAGYTFIGWFTAANGGEEYTENTVYTTTNDITLYAHWTINNYTITYRYNDLVTPESVDTKPYNTDITLPVPTRTGYTFKEWNTAQNGSGTRYAAGYVYTLTANTILYAQWDINKYTVTFDAQGGTPVAQQKVEHNSTITAVSTRTGYTFNGWFTAIDGIGTKYDANQPVTGNITLYAHWAINNYNITYRYNDLVTPESVDTKPYKTDITLPAPTRTGYTFNGWTTAQDGSGIKYAAGYVYTLTANTILYAQWEINKYTVTFEEQGGTAVKDQDKVVHNSKITLPEITRTGYTFKGWFTTSDGNVKYDAAQPVTADITLYAQWDVITYIITFKDPASSTIIPKPITYGASVGILPSVLTKEIPARTGYLLLGWNTEKDGSGGEYKDNAPYNVTADIVLYAQWTPETYKISFDSKGGAPVDDLSVRYNVAVGKLPEPVRVGYVFDGWFTDANYSGEPYTSLTVYDKTVNTTLFAKWIAGAYTLQFDARGGTVESSSKSAVYGTAVGELPLPSLAGYEFGGWFTEIDGGGTKYVAATVYNVVGNTTLFAKWTLKKYTITFDSQGGAPVAGIQANYNDNVTLSDPLRPGYTFKGWNTAKDGTGISYVGTIPYTIDGNATLYAQWTVNVYELDFDEQGGNHVNNQSATYDAAIGTLPKPTRTGHTFKGWFTGINGGGIEYTSTTVYKIAGNTTLYAFWEATKYALVFDINYAGGFNPAIQTVTYGKSVVTLPTVARPGYIFKAWNTAQDGSGTAYTVETVYSETDSITLYAQWVAGVYIISFEANYLGDIVKPENPTPKNIVYGAVIGELPVLTHAGYIFTGWNTAENGSGVTYTETTIYAEPGNITLYAQWTGITYTASFTGDNVEIDPQPVTHGTKIVRPSDPTLQGYVFGGWYKDNDLWDFNTPVTGNVMLTAKWISSDSKLKSLTITQGKLSPEFSPSLTDYMVLLSYDVATVSVTGMSRHPNASLTGNVENASLAVGDNIISVEVTAEDGVNKTIYRIRVTRADHILVSDANLLSLSANSRPVPVEGNTLEYVAACGETSFAIELNASPYASVAIDGSSYSKGQVIEMTGDVTTVNIHIVSETGAVKDYVLKANKALDSDRLYYYSTRMPDILSINANFDENGGYEVLGYRWYDYTGKYIGNKGFITIQSTKDYAEIRTVQTEGWRRVCGIPVTKSLAKITAYPNPVPSGESVKLELPDQYVGGTLNIYNITGALVKSGLPLPASVNSIDVSSLNSGIYLFNITDKDGGNHQAVKIIVE